jgi:hypothetical protein
MIEALYNTSHLSDVGCTYKLLRADAAKRIAETMSVGGSHAGVEIMLLTILSGERFVEVPVNYLPRVGRSSVTGDPVKALGVGLQMIGLVLRLRRTAPRHFQRPAAFVAQAPGQPPSEQPDDPPARVDSERSGRERANDAGRSSA